MIIDNPAGARFQAILLKGHCKLMSKGMNHSKLSRTKVLQLAGQITGKTYKRGQHAIAAADLDAWIEANR